MKKVSKFLPVVLLMALALSIASAATTLGALTFRNTPLTRPEGDSEPAISIGANGTMAITGLQWLFDPSFFGTHLWKVHSARPHPRFRDCSTPICRSLPRRSSAARTRTSIWDRPGRCTRQP